MVYNIDHITQQKWHKQARYLPNAFMTHLVTQSNILAYPGQNVHEKYFSFFVFVCPWMTLTVDLAPRVYPIQRSIWKLSMVRPNYSQIIKMYRIRRGIEIVTKLPIYLPTVVVDAFNHFPNIENELKVESHINHCTRGRVKGAGVGSYMI